MEDFYTIYNRGLYKIGVSTYNSDLPATEVKANSLFSATVDEIAQTSTTSGTGIIQQQVGGSMAGKTKFDNTETGYILGIDSSVPKFYIGNTTNYLNWTGSQLLVSGNLTATTGSIGGFTIGANSLYAGDGATKIQLDTTQGIFMGANAFADAPYSVSLSGVLTATLGTIGGWTISSTSLSTGTFDTINKMYFGVSGLSLSNTFKVTSTGVLTSTSGVIGGWVISDTLLSSSGIIIDSFNQKIESTNYVSGSSGSGFHIDSNLLEVGNISARGLIRTAVFQKDVISTVGGNLAVLDGDVLSRDMSSSD